MLRWYTTVDGALKKQIITAMETILVSLIKDQLTGFRKFTALKMMYYIFRAYGAIDDIDL